MNKVTIVVYTNEKYFDLLFLTLPYTVKHTQDTEMQISVVSNKIPNQERINNIRYIDSNVEFCPEGSHFRDTLMYALEIIDTEYILFLCDDYLIKSPIHTDRLYEIVDVLDELKGDYFYLGTQKHVENFIKTWNKVVTQASLLSFPENCFYELDTSYRHLYSVQPCIWRKSSLIELLYYNPNLSLHQLDNTDIVNKKGKKRHLIDFYNFSFYETEESFFDYGFKNFCYHYPPLSYHVDERPLDSEFLVLDYIEIIRNGKFITSEVNSKKILNEILKQNNNILHKLQNFFN